MQKIQSIFSTLVIATLSFVLFLVGLGFLLFLFVAIALLGLFTKASTRDKWRKQWHHQWQSKRDSYRQPDNKQPATRVIEGEYSVQSHCQENH